MRKAVCLNDLTLDQSTVAPDDPMVTPSQPSFHTTFPSFPPSATSIYPLVYPDAKKTHQICYDGCVNPGVLATMY